MKVYSFEKLEAWVLAKDLTKQVYLLTKKFPNEEIYGLSSQIRRASISICSNTVCISVIPHMRET
jgi:hypothetical protein